MTDIFRELREESVKNKIIAKELSPQSVGGCAQWLRLHGVSRRF